MLERIKKNINFLILSLLISSNLIAGWTKTYGGNDIDGGSSVQQTADRGYIIAGYTFSYGSGNGDAYLIKTDSFGNLEWSRTYGGNQWDAVYSVDVSSFGGYIFVGETLDDIYIIKTNSVGDSDWVKTYGGSLYDECYSIQQVIGGNYIAVGLTTSFGAGSNDIYLINIDSDGDTVWTKTYGGIHSEIGESVFQTNDSGYIVVGSTSSYGAGAQDVYLIKTDSNGDSIWVRTFGGSAIDIGYSVQQTIDGGYIITGITYSSGAGSSDFYLIKTDINGDSVWAKTFGGSLNDEAYSVQQTIDGGYIIAGTTYSSGAGSSDFYLIKTDINGDSVWARTYGGGGDDKAYSVQQTVDTGYIVTGVTNSYGGGSSDVYLIKTDASGLLIVEEIIISTPVEFSYSIDQISNNFISLQFSLPENSNVELNIYDAAGRFLSTPLAGFFKAGVHNADIKIEKTGIYFFNIITDGFSKNSRFIVFK